MHSFIDESGRFTGFHEKSVSVVGALAVPDGKLATLIRKYDKLRGRLPMGRGEVKGRLLNGDQVDAVVELLAHNDVVFEAEFGNN